MCGTGSSLFQLTVKAPLALLVCQPERQRSESATSSSWVRATNGHLDPLANLTKRNAYLTRRKAFVWRLTAEGPCVCGVPGGHPSHLYFTHRRDFYLPIGCITAFLTGRFTLQAVPRLLDRVQSHTGLKDSHRYPTLTRCHCRDPMITISAPHETFMACWQ